MARNKKPVLSISGFLEIFFIAISILTVFSSFFHGNRLFELTSHFKVQYFYGSLFALVFYTIRKKKVLVLWFACTTVFNAYFVVPWYFGTEKSASFPDKPILKILHANVYTGNKHKKWFLNLIASEAPDMFIVQEVDDRWEHELSVVETNYPYHRVIPRSDNFGIALYSKIPLLKIEEITDTEFDVPSFSVMFIFDKQEVELIAMHPLPPVGEFVFQIRNAEINFIAEHCRDAIHPKILIGDLNVTPWSQHYIHLEKISQMRNCRLGHGILASWPTKIFPMRIPIDHCLISREFNVNSIRLGPDIGSDHLPLIVELSMKPVKKKRPEKFAK